MLGDDVDRRWLSVGEIAKHLGVSRDTVYRWIDEESLPAHKVGRLWKFDREDVDGWVRSRGGGDDGRGRAGESER